MKGKLSILVLTAMLLMGLGTNALAGNTFNFLGQTTWTVTITEKESGPLDPSEYQTVSMTGAISKLGPNYYLFQGSAQVPGDNPFFLAGAGNLITLPGEATQTLVMTLNTSQLHVTTPPPSITSNRDTGIMHVEINPADLSGSFYEIGHDFDTTNHTWDTSRFTAGILGAASPFININTASLAPVTSLLLE